MERTHGQLCTGFTDGLRSDHADSFTVVDQATATQVTAVTHGAQAEACFAIQCRAHFDFVDACGFDFINDVFVQHDASFDQHSTCFWIQHIFNRCAAQDTVAQGFDHFTTFNDGAHQLTVGRAAIVFSDDQVLGHVNQTTCQVT